MVYRITKTVKPELVGWCLSGTPDENLEQPIKFEFGGDMWVITFGERGGNHRLYPARREISIASGPIHEWVRYCKPESYNPGFEIPNTPDMDVLLDAANIALAGPRPEKTQCMAQIPAKTSYRITKVPQADGSMAWYISGTRGENPGHPITFKFGGNTWTIEFDNEYYSRLQVNRHILSIEPILSRNWVSYCEAGLSTAKITFDNTPELDDLLAAINSALRGPDIQIVLEAQIASLQERIDAIKAWTTPPLCTTMDHTPMPSGAACERCATPLLGTSGIHRFVVLPEKTRRVYYCRFCAEDQLYVQPTSRGADAVIDVDIGNGNAVKLSRDVIMAALLRESTKAQ